MRCHFVGTDGCETETFVMFQLQLWGRKGTVPCCAACWRILTDGATAPEPEPPKRVQVPQRERAPRVQLGLRQATKGEKPPAPGELTADLFG